MSLLSFLPRLTTWGSSQRQRDLETELGESEYSHETDDQKQDLYEYRVQYEIGKTLRKTNERKQISYWSDEEAIAIRSSR